MSRLRAEGGYSLVEMLTVMVIMAIVFGGLTTLFVQGSNAELDMNNRFQAQLGARLGLDKLRRELHCASASTSTTASSVTLSVPCVSGGTVSWCAVGSGTRWGLYRQLGASCSASGTKYVDYLTSGNAFWYDAQWTGSLAKLHVDLKVNPQPSRSVDLYELCDVIVLRNSTRTGSSSAPATVPNANAPC